MSRRNGTTRTSSAAAQAEADAILAAKLAEQANQPEDETTPPVANLADRFVAMNALIVHQRNTTRLAEATLVKNLELALNYHVWQTQRDEAAAREFNPNTMFDSDSPLVGPETVNEYIQESPTEAEGFAPVVIAGGRGEVINPPVEATPTTSEE